jgi:hypothetical protein
MQEILQKRHPLDFFTKSLCWTVLLLALAFLFRLFFGFFAVVDYEDQRQIYLIGLKYYCTGQWPYFGADVLPHVQIPGALQGLVVGLPLRIWPVPESPYVFVNILSFSALCLLGWYCSRRLPAFPKWIIWGWLFTAPWTLNISTNVYNVSYVLPGAVLFFIGFLESIPTLTKAAIPPWLANVMMGFAFFWNAQFHMSYVVQLPFLALSAYSQLRQTRPRDAIIGFACLVLGATVTVSFIAPTVLRYGGEGLGGTDSLFHLHLSNLGSFFVILARLFSLASAEVPRFIGRNITERMSFLRSEIWAAPFTVVTLGLGLLQPLVMLISLFLRGHPRQDWRAMKSLTLSTFLLVYISFAFASKSPKSHMYYMMLPLMMLFAFYVFSFWASKRWFQTTAAVLLICNIVFHVGLASFNYREKSFYSYRGSILRAIELKDYRQMGERRPEARY